MSSLPTILVTGAEEHQGLAVIRGLGRAGYPVIACGSAERSLGFHSRYATWISQYRSPHHDPHGFVQDVVLAARVHEATLIIPAVESTLVRLSAARRDVESVSRLAAPPADVLDMALDKSRTLALANRVGVPAPRTVRGDSAEALLERSAQLEFPVAIKPRGPRAHATTSHQLLFKSRYARSLDELAAIVSTAGADVPALLVQEYAHGSGRCVVAVCEHGAPQELFAYAREREYPHAGGVSVVRRSVALDERLWRHATALLSALRWHGVAMVEFRYDERRDQLLLMEVNGRFQASTALSLSAGMNLPADTVRLFLGEPARKGQGYRVGVRQRWVRGDCLALADRWQHRDETSPVGRKPPTMARAFWMFLADFRPGMHFDEFTRDDPFPALVELARFVEDAWHVARRALRAVWSRRTYRKPTPEPRASSALANVRAQRSMRA